MGEPTEKPTPKRRRKAREDGNVAKSGEFTGSAVMVCAGAALAVWMAEIVARSADLLRRSIQLVSGPNPAKADIGPFMLGALEEMAWMLGPVLAVGFVAAAFFNYVQIGALFTLDPLMPQANKLNAIEGFKKLVEPNKLVDLAKNVAKLSVASIVGYVLIRDKLGRLIELPRLSLWKAMVVLGDMCFELACWLGATLVAFGAADLIWQRHKHEKDLMMSKDEVEREHKESEGDPEMKGKRKKLHRELVADSGVKQVKDADAVVVNPTHVAVALQYDDDTMGAPTVLSAGRGEVARQIKRLARRYAVPIVRNVDLARALVSLDVDAQIPAEFYEPVAEVLNYVYQLRNDEDSDAR